MNIRKYQDIDKGALIALWESVFPADPPHNKPSKVIEQKLAVDDLIFAAEHRNEIVGACIAGYDGHRGWLYAVAVSHHHRRKGRGKRMVNTAINALRQLGCDKVNIQIRANNTAVVDFYEALGFSTEDRLSMGVFIQS